jgi:6-pyruvoyltetrahydropterin/6-carboxytetrahydropterin synthase
VYEVGTAATVTAFHVMPGMEGPEGTLHSHDYRIELVVTRADVGVEGWVCDLDLLDAALGGITAKLEGSDLEAIRPPSAEAVTVEVFARWLHDTLAGPVAAGGGETLAVRVWESPVAFGGYGGPVSPA